MTTPMPERYFASYFDAVKYPPDPDPAKTFPVDDWRRRWQWIVMPRLPRAGPDSGFVVFSRQQNDKTHRAVWRSTTYRTHDAVLESYSQFLHANHRAVPRDPIVVELSAAEVIEYVGEGRRKTPWEVINRAKRRARKLGYTI